MSLIAYQIDIFCKEKDGNVNSSSMQYPNFIFLDVLQSSGV